MFVVPFGVEILSPNNGKIQEYFCVPFFSGLDECLEKTVAKCLGPSERLLSVRNVLKQQNKRKSTVRVI